MQMPEMNSTRHHRKILFLPRAIIAFLSSAGLGWGQVQVILPADLASKLVEPQRQSTNSQVAFEPGQYRIQQETTYFRVEARIPFEILRAGESLVPLFAVPVYLQEVKFEPADLARLVTISNRLALSPHHGGSGMVQLSYRVPMGGREPGSGLEIPLVLGVSGHVRLESGQNDIDVVNGITWASLKQEKVTVYEIGVAAEDTLVLKWRGDGKGLAPATVVGAATVGPDLYGIGITRAQNLTIINSDGSCSHFAEFELPVSQSDEFRLKLPAKTRLMSVSVNGNEISSPAVEEQVCRIRLPARGLQQTAHRLSFRLACSPVHLAFIGVTELTLPETFQIIGTLEWVVALPQGFDTQVISSALQTQKSAANLVSFGDYGRILKSHPHSYLAKDLVPPGPVHLGIKYRQAIPGVYETRAQ
jgi:hypothetical protein